MSEFQVYTMNFHAPTSQWYGRSSVQFIALLPDTHR